MKKFLIFAGAMVAAGAVHAGTATISYEPIRVQPTDDSGMSGALVLLALVGIVIASGSMAGFATRGKAEMLPEEPEDM